MKNFKGQICILAGLIACFGITGTASATAVGMAQLTSCLAAPGGLSGVLISSTQIIWSPNGTVAGTGCFNTGSPTTITSTQPTIISGDTGNIKDLSAGGGAVDQFLTFVVPVANLDFVLTAFGPTGTTSTACDSTIGDSCIVVPGSPFELTNTTGGVEVGFTTLGTIVDGGVMSNWVGLFTTQVSMIGARETAAEVQSLILAGGSISSTYSATLTVNGTSSSVPEPSTASMLILAGVGLIGIGRKRFVKR
jgi:PEP-CTERM motif